MIRSRKIEALTALLLAVVLALCLLLPRYAAAAGGIEQQYESTLFGSTLVTVDIQIDEDDWQEMLDNAIAEEYVPCDVVINGTTFSNVGIRPKGNTSLTQIAADDTTDRYSFKIQFDEYQDGQTCWGLDKLVLNNLMADPTYVKEYLVYDMFDFIGLPASCYAMAEVTVNGEPWGVYLALEAVEESFLLRNYGRNAGELYKPDSMNMGGGRDMGEGMEPPEGMELPEGMEFPEGMEPPEGMEFPEGMMGGRHGFAQDAAGTEEASDGTATEENAAPAETVTPPEGAADGITDGSTEGAAAPEGMTPPDFAAEDAADRGGFGGGRGGMMGGSGSDLVYTDDDLDSYSAIWESAVTDTDDADHERVVAALRNLAEGGPIEDSLDVDAMARYLAVQTFVVNLDSLSGNMAHNYYLYEDDGKLSLLPWDYNTAFGGFQGGDASDVVNFPIDTPVSGVSLEDRPLFAAIINDEEGCALYHEYLRQLCEEYVQGGRLALVYQLLRNVLDERVGADPTAFYTEEEYTAGIEMLYTLIEKRAESILGQLDGTIPSTTEGQQADPDALVDCTGLDLNVTGVQNVGGGGGMDRGGKMGGFGRPDGVNDEASAADSDTAADAADAQTETVPDSQTSQTTPAAPDGTSDSTQSTAPDGTDGVPSGAAPAGAAAPDASGAPPSGAPEGGRPADRADTAPGQTDAAA